MFGRRRMGERGGWAGSQHRAGEGPSRFGPVLPHPWSLERGPILLGRLPALLGSRP